MMTAVSRPTSATRSRDGRSNARRTARIPTNTTKISSEYMRADVAYATAYGLADSTSTAAHAVARPPMRFPQYQAGGSDATANTPESDLTAKSDVPNSSIQKCNSR